MTRTTRARDRLLAPVARALGRPLVGGTARASRADAVVVLGAPLGPGGAITPVLEERLRAAIELLRDGIAPILCTSGGVTRGAPISEAEAMAAWARGQGVPERSLLVEARSGSTYENASKVAELLLPRGMRRVIVVTTPFHLRRSVRWFRHFGFEAAGHHIEDSLQYRNPAWGLRWIGREYLSWVTSGTISAARWLWPRAFTGRGGR